MKFTYSIPTKILFGPGSFNDLATTPLPGKKALVVITAGKSMRANGYLDRLIDMLDKQGIGHALFDKILPNPVLRHVHEGAALAREQGCDFVIGLGGGSSIDSAKSIAVMAKNPGDYWDYISGGSGKGQPLVNGALPIVAIATTAGTGSEATPNAIVAVPEQELKVGIVSDAMIADNVLLDPLMIKNLPRKIAAATGVDALAHAIECYTSNKANPISDTFALEALDMILNNILPACDSADAVSQKSAMQLASFYAGVAITASGTTAVHALSYPLGGKYHIAHGVSNAILLAPVMRFNAPACPERFAAAYDRCVHGEKTCVTQEEKTEFMLRWLEKIVRHLEIPTSLSAFGVSASDLETLVAAGMQVTRLLNNNLRPVTADDARALYRRIL